MFDNITVCKLNNPFNHTDRVIKTIPYEPDKDFNYYVNFDTKSEDGIEWVAAINGGEIDLANLPMVREGDHITICPRLQGGGGISGILRIVAMIALAFVAPQLVGMMAGLGWGAIGTTHVLTMMGSLVSGGIMIAGSMLINAILPPATPDTPKIGNDTWNESPTYSWNPLQQTTGQGQSIPIIFGTVRVSGHEISKFIRTSGTKQYVNIMLGVADVPINREIEAVAGTSHNEVTISDIRINSQSKDNYDEVTVYTRTGTPTDTYIPGFDKLVQQLDLGQKLVYNDAVNLTTVGDALDQYEIELSAPYGMFYMNNSGNLETRSASIRVRYKKSSAGSWTTHSTNVLSGATTKVVRKTVLIDGLEYGESYDIEILRTTPEVDSTKEKSSVFVVAVREIIERRLIYPGLAKYAITALATDQLSGGVPAIDCLAERATVDVYNPNTSSWVTKSATNVAWAYYAYLNTHNEVHHSEIIYDEISVWADYCDELIAGKPRFAINLIMDTLESVWSGAQKICQVGRAMPIKRGSKWGVAVDMPSIPVQLFTMGNIEQGSFNLDYVALEDRANGIEVTYIDADREHSRQTISVLTDEYDDTDSPDNVTSVRSFGATDRDQVIRDQVFKLNNNQNLFRVINFGAFIDSIVTQVGDLFYFTHDAPNWGISGRLVSATTTEVVLDQQVQMLANTDYSVIIRTSDDDTVHIKAINRVTLDTVTETLTLTSAFSAEDVPALYDVYGFGQTSTLQRIYRCVGFGRTKDLYKSIIGVEYRAEVYTDSLKVIDLPDTRDKVQTVSQVFAQEQVSFSADGTYKSVISVSWHTRTDYVGTNWEVWAIDNNDGSIYGPFFSNSDNILLPTSISHLSHTFTVYVTPPTRGPVQIGNNYDTVTINGVDDPPPDVTSFLVSNLADGTRRFTFSMTNTPIDLAGYTIRCRQGSSWTWAEMEGYDLTDGLIVTSPFETNSLQAGTYVFAIKAVDYSRNESLTDLQIVTTLGNPRMGNVIYDAYPTGTWPGTLTNCYISNDGSLQGKDTKTWADFATDGIDWSEWTSWARVPVTQIDYVYTTIDLGAKLTFTPIINVEGNGNVSLFGTMSYSDDNVTYTSTEEASAVPISARYIKCGARAVCNNGSVPSITIIEILLSADPLTDEINDRDTSTLSTGTGDTNYRVVAGDIYLKLSKTFNVITQVQVTLQNVGGGWSWELISKTTTKEGKLAPHIKIYNATPSLADATIDAYIKGV